MGAAWPSNRSWNGNEELAYSKWIGKLGQRSWKSAQKMLHNKSANSLYDPSDEHLIFRADCGDLPFVLRSYYAYKRQLPFITTIVRGGNYSPTPNPTIAMITNQTFQGDARDFFLGLPDMVSTAHLRTDYRQKNTACYPIAIDRNALRSGTIFYDPHGHTAVVCAVETDGTIRCIDAHPDQSITRTVFGPKLHWKTSIHNGGFLRFRPIRQQEGHPVFENNIQLLPHLSTEQYHIGKDYHMKIKLRLAQVKLDPIKDLERYIRNDTHQETLDRVEAVKRGWAITRHTPIRIPSNIYNSSGPWEDYSTPGRDMRLRLSYLNIPVRIRQYITLSQQSPTQLVTKARNPDRLLHQLIQTQKRLFKELTISYPNSQGKLVTLSLHDIEQRLFLLSFDPNHAPELRWGAQGKGLKSATRNRPHYYAGYPQEQSWRNRLIKKTGPMLPSDWDNPKHPPRHDITRMVSDLHKHTKRLIP